VVNLGKRNVLGVLVDAVDYKYSIEKIIDCADKGKGLSVTALAVHGVMTAHIDPVLRYRINHLDLVVPDGQPVRWAMNSLYKTQLKERVYGPELMLRVCAQAAERDIPIFLFGSSQTVLQRLTENLKTTYPKLPIAGTRASAFRRLDDPENRALLDQIKDSGAKIVFVGLGCPRQEVWAFENTPTLSLPVIAVGAAFDFHAGTVPQAPFWMQSRGLEWLYRLTREPVRLWRRYLLLNPYFIWLFMLQKSGLVSFNPEKSVEPQTPIRFG
jgi:N-acetylglucosaminyldiphosphoundecaprenol N-acetyl-beta-D-mannosaminyltransferase